MARRTNHADGKETARSVSESKTGNPTSTEGRMADKEGHDDQRKQPEPTLSPAEAARILGQEVELKGGARLRYRVAMGTWEILRAMQEHEPAQFAALVAIVIHQRSLVELPAEALAGLQHRRMLGRDGSVSPVFAIVLRASFQEPTPDQVGLAYPVIHSSPEQVEEIRKASATGKDRLWRAVEETRRNEQGEDSLRPRG